MLWLSCTAWLLNTRQFDCSSNVAQRSSCSNRPKAGLARACVKVSGLHENGLTLSVKAASMLLTLRSPLVENILATRRSMYREKPKTRVLGLGERTGVRGVANDPAAIGGDVLIGVEAIGRHKGVPRRFRPDWCLRGRPAWYGDGLVQTNAQRYIWHTPLAQTTCQR